jgi:hypothetical protein
MRMRRASRPRLDALAGGSGAGPAGLPRRAHGRGGDRCRRAGLVKWETRNDRNAIIAVTRNTAVE